MERTALVIAEMQPAHFDAILRLEREAGGRSVVALTHGHALREAHDRGHLLLVALRGEEPVGWAWCSVDAGRDGETAGHIYRVAVAAGGRRLGVGRALAGHARATLAGRGVTRLRTTVPGDDPAARAFFEAQGFAVDALVMERPL